MVTLIHILLLLGATVGLLVLGSWSRVYKGTAPHVLPRLAHVPQEGWARLNGRTIFFGHQSVGYNIVDGIRDHTANHGSLSLRIVETKDAGWIDGPMLAHAQVGQNLDPESKITEFKMLMEGGLGEKVDIAFFKFCYADVGINSNPDAIFAAYCEAINSLKTRFPHVTFLHVTVPLCATPKTIKGIVKAGIKRLIGRPTVLDANRVRAQYNTLLRERLSGKEPLFDLALYETLGPNGLRHYSFKDGQQVPVLVRSYTDDGGHLNVIGRRHVAEQLLIQLSGLCGDS